MEVRELTIHYIHYNTIPHSKAASEHLCSNAVDAVVLYEPIEEPISLQGCCIDWLHTYVRPLLVAW